MTGASTVTVIADGRRPSLVTRISKLCNSADAGTSRRREPRARTSSVARRGSSKANGNRQETLGRNVSAGAESVAVSVLYVGGTVGSSLD
jgi:hypothetical protein